MTKHYIRHQARQARHVETGSESSIVTIPVPMNNNCPKCGNLLLSDHDEYGIYLNCTACGYYYDKTVPESIRIIRGSRETGMTASGVLLNSILGSVH